ncbi:transcriptional activator RfaH [Porphyrobacter sp. TH134]|uniref:transcription termination/antitermination protein NusG n=1 Tax=Porphyrobacter sp. TH134 TaxID=2067450 RepID=UPI000C7DAAE7|nr:transcriptional activator RfaH [Porphyrobacter sp. TH134]PLK22547.1 transcriptional activator RfaH [Porphyrobacter sp. TH134]
MADWFLVQVKPNGDRSAKRNLERQGFVTFQPMEKRMVARAGGIREQTRPFFSGYLFISYPGTAAPWSLVNSTYGVSRLVRFGARPAPVPCHVISELRAACDANGIVTLPPGIAAGATVEVSLGTFANLIGQVEQLSPDQRAMVLLDFMGKQTKVSLPSAHLRVIGGSVKHSGGYR